MRAPRFTPQLNQEQISRGQLHERLTKFGWVLSEPSVDLGEDFIVHIYLEGRATGITFHVQLKSVTDLVERHKGDYLVYDFEVKDLIHWGEFSQPVVLVVWDVHLREGRWALVEEIISDLNQRRPLWRDNKTKVRVHIPWDNTTDDAGLVRLRRSIGQHFYPLIAKDEPFQGKMEFVFPNTDEGQAALKGLEAYVKEGEPVAINGKFIQELGLPDWWTRWFGDYDADTMELTLGPLPYPEIFFAHLNIIDAGGETASISAIELKRIKSGLAVVHLSNEHQNLPLHLYIVIRRNSQKYEDATISYSLNVRLNVAGHSMHQIREAMKFLQILTRGGKLRLTFPALNNTTLEMSVLPQPEKMPDPERLQLLDNLCKIQRQTAHFIQIPQAELTQTDLETIHELTEIIEQGRVIRRPKSITASFKIDGLELILDVHRRSKRHRLTVIYPESWVELFGQIIPTGPTTHSISGSLELSVNDLEKAVTTLAEGEELTLKFIDCEVVEIYPDWFKREAQRLSRLLSEKFAVEAVYLFGSLVWRNIHSRDTDIDLAVSGLPPERYLEAVAYLDQESNFPVDLVDLNKVPDSLRQRIMAEGQLLDEREPIAAFS